MAFDSYESIQGILFIGDIVYGIVCRCLFELVENITKTLQNTISPIQRSFPSYTHNHSHQTFRKFPSLPPTQIPQLTPSRPISPYNFCIMSNYSYLFKLIVIGDTSVGKSCMLLQFLEKKFKFDHDTTIGVQFGSKIVSIGERPVKLQIWDTAGQETFKSITRSYYRGSIGVVLVYDLTNRESFANIGKWLDETKAYANDKVTCFLVANKTDLQSKRAVSYDEGFNCAKKNGLMFMECSAKSGQNIEAVFLHISQAILGKIDKGDIDPRNESIGIKLGTLEGENMGRKKEGGCCA